MTGDGRKATRPHGRLQSGDTAVRRYGDASLPQWHRETEEHAERILRLDAEILVPAHPSDN